MPTLPNADRFQALDSWRGVCALLVAATHFHIDSHVYTNAFLRHAGLFVDFFFVLSGFVITHAYGRKLASPDNVREFVIRRFGRLWPLHAVMLLLFEFDARQAGVDECRPDAARYSRVRGRH